MKDGDKKNIFLIGVDSLRADTFRKYINRQEDTIKRFDIYFDCYTQSGPTQMAHPSIVCGEMPLDNGGYQDGILKRKQTIAESLRRYGFKTFGFAVNSWLDKSFGYDRGFEEWHQCYNLFTIWTDRAILINDLIQRKKNSEAIVEVEKRFYAFREALKGKKNVVNSVDLYTEELLWQFLNEQEEIFKKNKYEYVSEIKPTQLPYELINKRPEKKFKSAILNKIESSKLPRKIKSIIIKNSFRLYADLSYQMSIVKEDLREKNNTHKFYWLYSEELHELNWTDHDNHRNVKGWLELLSNYLYKKIYRKHKNIPYEKSIHYVLSLINKFVDDVNKIESDFENYFIVYSDHGFPLGDIKDPCEISKNYLNVPMLHSKNIKNIIGEIKDKNISNKNIKEIIESVAKNSKYKQDTEQIILFENNGRGSIDLIHKPIKIGLLSNSEIKTYDFLSGKYLGKGDVPECVLNRIQKIQNG